MVNCEPGTLRTHLPVKAELHFVSPAEFASRLLMHSAAPQAHAHPLHLQRASHSKNAVTRPSGLYKCLTARARRSQQYKREQREGKLQVKER